MSAAVPSDAPPPAWADSFIASSRVTHRRHRPAEHRLEHRTLHVLVDVDDLERLDRTVTGFGVDRRAAVAVRRRDHLDGADGPQRERLARLVADAGATLPSGRLQLLAHPRMLGHVFNPVAWWFSHHPDGRLGLVVAEVTSTFGDRSLYVLDDLKVGADGLHRARAIKHLHVSPFLPVDGLRYAFAVLAPQAGMGSRVLVHMEVSDADGVVLTATQDARLEPFTTRALWRAALRHPSASRRALAAIHWHALRLWLRRVPFHPRPEPPADALLVRGRPPQPSSDRNVDE
jgi:DUF1365 family protein